MSLRCASSSAAEVTPHKRREVTKGRPEPKDATHWQMMVDSPPTPAARWQEIREKNFKDLMKKEFPDPTVPNLLIESTLRKFYFHD